MAKCEMGQMEWGSRASIFASRLMLHYAACKRTISISYQIHRWDYETPIEETLEALHDMIKMGKVRYIGASSMFAWPFAKALYMADLKGWTRFISMQNHYNLVYREEEREMNPLCVEEGIGI